MRRLQREAAIGPLTDEWLASFFPHEDIDDVFYCTASDHGALPPDVVHDANNAGTN